MRLPHDPRVFLGALFALALVLGALAVHAEPAKKAPSKKAEKSAPAPAPAGMLSAVEVTARPKADYQAEVYAGVALDDAYAKERGLGDGLVLFVFEKQRRAAFRIGREKIKKLVRFVVDEPPAPIVVVKTAARGPRDRIDVIDTDEGVYVVETLTTNAGIFTTSDVYALGRAPTLEQRLAVLERVSQPARERLRRAVVAAYAKAPSDGR